MNRQVFELGLMAIKDVSWYGLLGWCMRHFDHDYVVEVIQRLGAIKPAAKPQWGTLTPQELIQHLGDSVRSSMGRAGAVNDRSNLIMRKIVAPLILNEIIRIPKNVKAPAHSMRSAHDDIETLQALLEEYLGLVQADELKPEPHPAFGNIGVDGWAKMHFVHFEHHFRQFGV